MSPDEFTELCEGVRKDGLREPIITFNGEVLDGQNRQNACEVAKRKPIFKAFKGTEKEALEFVIAKNFQRRHLNPGQRAMIAVQLADCRNSDTSLSEAAKTVQVHRGTAQLAKRVKSKAPALAKKVASGKITLNAAIVKISEPRQRREFNPYGNGVAPSITAPTEKKTDESDKRSGAQIIFELHGKSFGKLSGGAPSWDSVRPEYKNAWAKFADDLTAMFA